MSMFLLSRKDLDIGILSTTVIIGAIEVLHGLRTNQKVKTCKHL